MMPTLQGGFIKDKRSLTLRAPVLAPNTPIGEEFLPPSVVGEVEPKVETFADLPVYDSVLPPFDPYDTPFPPQTATLTHGAIPAGSVNPGPDALEYMASQTRRPLSEWTRTVNQTIGGGDWVVKNMGVTWSYGGEYSVDIECQSSFAGGTATLKIPSIYASGTTAWTPVTMALPTSSMTMYEGGTACSESTRYVRFNSMTSSNTGTWTWAGSSPSECECTWAWYDSDATTVRRASTRHGIKSRRQTLAEIIKQRAFPGIHIKPSRNYVQPASDPRELRARETLKRVVGDDSYRGFLANGFVSVKSRRTQRVYVIYPGHGQTKVFHDGKFIERLCVVLPGDFPPTDSLITRYLMILNDEAHFRSLANKSTYADAKPRERKAETKSLVEIALELPARYQREAMKDRQRAREIELTGETQMDEVARDEFAEHILGDIPLAAEIAA